MEANERHLLTKKLLCRCPVCQKNIYSNMLDLQKIDINLIELFPFPITYTHKTENEHALTLYLDANLAVRDVLTENEIGKIIGH